MTKQTSAEQELCMAPDTIISRRLLGGPGSLLNGVISRVTVVVATARVLTRLVVAIPGPPRTTKTSGRLKGT